MLHSRRALLQGMVLAAVGKRAGQKREATMSAEGTDTLKYCLNTGTIRGQALGAMGELEVAARAGYDAIEPWVRDLKRMESEGTPVETYKKRLEDAGMTMESAIAFPRWIVDDEEERAKGLEEVKRVMDIVARAGGKRVACPPSGATEGAVLDLLDVAERYRAVLKLGEEMDVVPQVEVWGFSINLHRLGQAVCVAVESGHPKACILADVYHLYRGGSSFEGLSLLTGTSCPVLHMNDYPAEPERENLTDADRVLPGDGVAPMGDILSAWRDTETHQVLSLELFNRTYWERDALDVAKEGLEKMKSCAG